MDPFEIQEKVGVLEEFVRAPVYCKVGTTDCSIWTHKEEQLELLSNFNMQDEGYPLLKPVTKNPKIYEDLDN